LPYASRQDRSQWRRGAVEVELLRGEADRLACGDLEKRAAAQTGTPASIRAPFFYVSANVARVHVAMEISYQLEATATDGADKTARRTVDFQIK
jgi:hypothetical protein